jgi:hypothetical protein
VVLAAGPSGRARAAGLVGLETSHTACCFEALLLERVVETEVSVRVCAVLRCVCVCVCATVSRRVCVLGGVGVGGHHHRRRRRRRRGAVAGDRAAPAAASAAGARRSKNGRHGTGETSPYVGTRTRLPSDDRRRCIYPVTIILIAILIQSQPPPRVRLYVVRTYIQYQVCTSIQSNMAAPAPADEYEAKKEVMLLLLLLRRRRRRRRRQVGPAALPSHQQHGVDAAVVLRVVCHLGVLAPHNLREHRRQADERTNE